MRRKKIYKNVQSSGGVVNHSIQICKLFQVHNTSSEHQDCNWYLSAVIPKSIVPVCVTLLEVIVLLVLEDWFASS